MGKKERRQAMKLLANCPDFDDSEDETVWLRKRMKISEHDLDIIYSQEYEGKEL